jgi:hypothetical protein
VTVSSADVEDAVDKGKEEGEVMKWCVEARILRRESWYCLYLFGGRLLGRMLPAPPWMIIRGVMPEEDGFLYSMVVRLLMLYCM